jgi:hypothetical protein
MTFDPATIISAILGAPPKAQPPSFVPDQVKRQAALQSRVHQEFRLVPTRYRQAAAQATPPRPRIACCPRCALPRLSCVCPRG